MSLFPIAQAVNTVGMNLFYDKVVIDGDRSKLLTGGKLFLANHWNHANDSFTSALLFGAPSVEGFWRGEVFPGRSDVRFLAFANLWRGLLGFRYSHLSADDPERARLEMEESHVRHRLMRSMNMIPLHREEDGEMANQTDFNYRSLQEAAQWIADGHVIVVYPDAGSRCFDLRSVRAGIALVACLATALAEGSEVSPEVAIASLTYSGFHEQLHGEVTVTLDDPIPLSKWFAPIIGEGIETIENVMRRARITKRPRREFGNHVEERLHSLCVLPEVISDTPYDDKARHSALVLRIEQVGALLSGAIPDTVARMRKAGEIVSRIEREDDESRQQFYQRLDEYFIRIPRVFLVPGQERVVDHPHLLDLALAAPVWSGVALHIVPVLMVGAKTRKPPEDLYLRGQQQLGTAMSYFGAWYLFLSLASVEAVRVGDVSPLLMLAGYLANAGLGILAAKRYRRVNISLARVFLGKKVSKLEDLGDELLKSMEALEKRTSER